jgi:uncharacterized protein YjiS (DUF1127 family)
MTSMTNHHPHSNSQLAEISAFVGRPIAIAAHIARHFKERRELNRLLSYPDYLLKDIGLQRSDMQQEALKPLYRQFFSER